MARLNGLLFSKEDYRHLAGLRRELGKVGVVLDSLDELRREEIRLCRVGRWLCRITCEERDHGPECVNLPVQLRRIDTLPDTDVFGRRRKQEAPAYETAFLADSWPGERGGEHEVTDYLAWYRRRRERVYMPFKDRSVGIIHIDAATQGESADGDPHELSAEDLAGRYESGHENAAEYYGWTRDQLPLLAPRWRRLLGGAMQKNLAIRPAEVARAFGVSRTTIAKDAKNARQYETDLIKRSQEREAREMEEGNCG